MREREERWVINTHICTVCMAVAMAVFCLWTIIPLAFVPAVP